MGTKQMKVKWEIINIKCWNYEVSKNKSQKSNIEQASKEKILHHKLRLQIVV